MKQANALELVAAGTLLQPGPIGRLVRFVIGLFCLYALFQIARYWEGTAAYPLTTLGDRIPLLVAPLCIINYVVNIGFSRQWGSYPLIASLTILGLTAVVTYAVTGSFDHILLGTLLNVWLAYCYGHLGFCFILAAALATPGCEMRAIPDLLGRVRGQPAPEHRCPAAFITRIDEWEHSKAG